eukprot:scaffold360_cov374-Pavlova_lutheri.AAC.87
MDRMGRPWSVLESLYHVGDTRSLFGGGCAWTDVSVRTDARGGEKEDASHWRAFRRWTSLGSPSRLHRSRTGDRACEASYLACEAPRIPSILPPNCTQQHGSDEEVQTVDPP